MPQCILTDFKVSGPKSWNVQIAMSVKLRLPCFSKDIQAWLLHAFDICRLVSPLPQHELMKVLRAEPLIVVSSARRFASSLAPPFSLPLLTGPASSNALSPHGSGLPDTFVLFLFFFDYLQFDIRL